MSSNCGNFSIAIFGTAAIAIAVIVSVATVGVVDASPPNTRTIANVMQPCVAVRIGASSVMPYCTITDSTNTIICAVDTRTSGSVSCVARK